MSKRILVVDDNQDIRAILRDLLEEEAYDVETASDGLSAWEKLTGSSGNYEAVILDMHMPRMNGLQLIQRLRHWRETLLLSVLASSSDNQALQQAMALGVRHTLRKPFELEEILTQVAFCLSELEESSVVT